MSTDLVYAVQARIQSQLCHLCEGASQTLALLCGLDLLLRYAKFFAVAYMQSHLVMYMTNDLGSLTVSVTKSTITGRGTNCCDILYRLRFVGR